MPSDSPRGLLIDDSDVVRTGLRTCLEEEEIKVVGETDDPEAGWTLIKADQPDLILLHSCLPPTGGIPLCERITQRYPEIKVILTDPDPFATDNLGFAQAFQAGARACLSRSALTHEICIATIQAVLASQRLFTEDIRLRALRLEPLTPREEEVLALLAQEKTNAEIMQTLYLAEGTVRNYVSRILSKLDMEDRRETELYARRLGLVTKVGS